MPEHEFLLGLSAPARRALEREGIDSSKKLASYTEAELLKLHGFGPGSLPKLRAALKKEGFYFRK